MLNGKMRLKAMPEKNSTSAEFNFTTEIAMQSIRNDHSFILETESITVHLQQKCQLVKMLQ